MERKTLAEIGLKHKTDKSTICHNYLPFYEQHLPSRDFSGRLLEIGVWTGASLRMWREYYPYATIIGVDIQIRSEKIEGASLIEMDASDAQKLSTLGMFDIVIDDASHMCSHQQIAFNQIYYNQLNDGGLYVMEDLQTSFLDQYKDTDVSTYDIMKLYDGHIEYNGNDGGSMSIIIPKS